MKRPPNPMSGFVAKALGDADLKARCDARPWYQRNDFLGWINSAKRDETKAKRLRQTLDEFEAG